MNDTERTRSPLQSAPASVAGNHGGDPDQNQYQDRQTPSRERSVDDIDRSNDAPVQPREIGGRKKGPDPVRYGDWEKNGRCIDF